MLSRRQRQLLARKEPHNCPQDLKRKKVLEKIEEQAKNTENIIARLRARLDVLDLVVDKTLPEESFLDLSRLCSGLILVMLFFSAIVSGYTSKELNPWKFRRNERLHNKWTLINSVVSMQEFLVAAAGARTRRDQAGERSLHSDLQHSSLTPGEKVSCSEDQSVLNTSSLSWEHGQEAANECRSNITADSSQGLPKEASKVRNQYKGHQQAGPETLSVSHSVSNSDTALSRGAVASIQIQEASLPKQEGHYACSRSRTEDNVVVLPEIMIDDSQVKPDVSTKAVPATSSKTKQPSITASPGNGNNGYNQEFLKLDNKFNRNQQKQKCRPSLKPVSMSKNGVTARDLEKTLTFGWIPQPDSEVCQYCRKSVCVGQRFRIHLAGKRQPDVQPRQSQLSVRMQRRIADITAIYGFGHR